jgi:phosphohistidine phosphatase SixA
MTKIANKSLVRTQTTLCFVCVAQFQRLEIKMRTTLFVILLFLSSVGAADELLWQKVEQEPNIVVFMRNAESSGNRDGSNMLKWDSSGKCIGESTLTSTGRVQAKRVGEAFEKRGIKPLVISSPMCRCKETAQIAFGEFLTDPDLRQRPAIDTVSQEAFQKTASELFTKHRGKSPIVFVNHRPNIDALTMELISIGELLVGTLDEDGEIEVLGKIRLEQ